MSSPLFPNFNRFTRQQQDAIRKWLASQGKSGIGAGPNTPRTGRPTQYGKGGSGSTPVGGSGPTGDSGNWLWKSLLSKLGPLGQIIDSLLRPNGESLAPSVQHELQAAQQLLESFGYAVGEPGKALNDHPLLGGSSGTGKVREKVDERPGTQKPEANPGGSSRPPRDRSGVSAPSPAGNDQPDSSEQPDVTVSPTGTLIEGMIPVRSSNVHSIGYEWNPQNAQAPGNLLVRFLGGTGSNRTGKGPLYRYFDVPRNVFVAFKQASSKGKFVWDDLRVRGSMTGHQYAYDLAGTGDTDYVPRQVGLKRGAAGEHYLNRNFAGRRSTLPEQQIRGSRRELTPGFKQKAKKLDFRAGRRGA